MDHSFGYASLDDGNILDDSVPEFYEEDSDDSFQNFDESSMEDFSDYSDGEDVPTEEQELYGGSELTVKDFNLMFMIYASKHCLSDKAKISLLEMFRIVLPDGNLVPSLYMMEKSIEPLTTQPNHFNLCAVCHTQLTSNKCVNDTCDKSADGPLPIKERLCYYVMDIKSYIEKIVSGKI